MNSDKKTTSFRYLVIGNGKIMYCAENEKELEAYVQSKPASDVAVYQRRFIVESALCSVNYEYDSVLNQSDEEPSDE